jgi:leader peptidase (prepilin peptidase)/N-methyltransferase
VSALETLAVAFAAVLGAIVGSFLNVCIWRMPRPGLSVSRPARSHCPGCGTPIGWRDNLPIWSWLRLGGRCRACHAPISVRYLTVEALTAMLFAVLASLYLREGDFRWPEFVVLAVLAAALVTASFIDIDLRIIPDEITIAGMLALPAVALAVPDLHARAPDGFIWDSLSRAQAALEGARRHLPEELLGGGWSLGVAAGLGVLGALAGLYGYRGYQRWARPREPRRLRDGAIAGVLVPTIAVGLWSLLVEPRRCLDPRAFSLTSALVGSGAGAGLVFGVGVFGSLIFRKEAMGFGDVKLMGLLGGIAGWDGVLGGFALACLLGSVIGIWRLVIYRTRYLPFGPFLSVGTFTVILYPDAAGDLLEWWMGRFR